jgi:pilus assembly protein CpaB
MKLGRLAVLAIALIAGLAAAVLVSGFSHRKPPPPVQQVDNSAKVLTLAANVPMGGTIESKDLAWTSWPRASAHQFVSQSADPNARQKYVGARAREALYRGEPLRPEKLVLAKGAGFLSAILPEGMRAFAIDISATTGAGGFILPNDHVDVILTQRRQGSGAQSYSSAIILKNMRVLAIDQSFADKNGQKVVVGRTATLAVTPAEAEMLAQARQQGTLSLALRSLADFDAAPHTEAVERHDDADGVTVVRYGVATTAAQ